MRRPLSGFVAIAAAAMVLTACGSGGGTESTSAAPSANPSDLTGTVTYWDTSNVTEQPVFKELVAQFEKAYPNVKVTYTPVPFEKALTNFKNAAQAGNGAPDVFRSDVGWVPQLAQLGYLADVTGTPAVVDQSDYLAGPWGTGTYNGKQYGVPQVTDAPALLYNKALLQKAGVTPPTTWDELTASASKFKAAGLETLRVAGATTYFVLPWIYADGGNLVDTESKKIVINDAESVAGITQRLDMQNDGTIVKDLSPDSYNNMMAAFKDGKVAMIVNGPWSVADILSGSAFKSDPSNLGVGVIPNGTKTGSSPVGGHDYVAYAGSPNLAAANAFIGFMSSAESQAYLSSKLPLLPTRKSAYTAPAVTGGPSAAVITAFGPVMDAATTRPTVPVDLFDADVQAQMDKILAGTVSPQEGADAIAQIYLKNLSSLGYTD